MHTLLQNKVTTTQIKTHSGAQFTDYRAKLHNKKQ